MNLSRRGFLGGLLATAAISASGAAIVIPQAPEFAGDTGWLLCNGQAISRTAYPRLFEVIQYAYGGDGDSFNLPDMRSRFDAVVTETAVRPIGEIVYAINPEHRPITPVGQMMAFFLGAGQ